MNKTQFGELMQNPDLLSESTLDQLKEIVDAFPFFQIGRMLMLKNLHKLDHIRFNSELKHSAAYISDRSKLFFLLNDLTSAAQKKEEIEHAEEKTETASKEVVGKDTELVITKENSIKRKETNADDEQKIATPTNSPTDNYLNASDEYTDEEGNTYDFKASIKEEEEAHETNLQNIIFPAADLLDYEITTSAGYSLSDLSPENTPDLNESRSFSDWLHIMRHHSTSTNSNDLENKQPPKKMDLIDNFLNSNPKIIPKHPKKSKTIDLSESGESSGDDILSETLAEIYIKQGHNSKAISIFEKLRLKYPEKNVYFARRISDLKEK